MTFDAFAHFYDLDYGDFSADILFYREMARLHGGPVLEAMCGTGRVALPLAAAGLDVTGVDIAPAMIARAQASAAAQGVQASFVVGDIRTLELKRSFGFALIAMNSLMHLETTADQLAALERLAAHLRPNGMLAIDLFNPDPLAMAQHDGVMVLDKLFQVPETGHTVQKYVVRSADLAAQHLAVTFCYDEIAADGTVRRLALPFGMRWVYRFELEHLLARAGFTLEAVYGSYDLDDYDNGADRILAMARRNR